MKKQVGQMAAEKWWQANAKTIEQCECEKKFSWMAEFFRSPRKSVRLEKQNVTVAVGRDAVS